MDNGSAISIKYVNFEFLGTLKPHLRKSTRNSLIFEQIANGMSVTFPKTVDLSPIGM